MGDCMRQIDLEYEKNPEKRKQDLERLKSDLQIIKDVYKLGESLINSEEKEAIQFDIVLQFALVGKFAMEIMYLYEALGFSFKNKKFNYPHTIIYDLESYLDEMKEIKDEKGQIVLAPANPKGKLILTVTGMKKEDYGKVNVDDLYISAKKLMEYLEDRIFSQQEIIR